MESFLNNFLEDNFVSAEFPEMGTIEYDSVESDPERETSFEKFSYPEIADPFYTEIDFSMPEFGWWDDEEYQEIEVDYNAFKKKFSDKKEFVQTLNAAYKKALRNNIVKKSNSINIIHKIYYNMQEKDNNGHICFYNRKE